MKQLVIAVLLCLAARAFAADSPAPMGDAGRLKSDIVNEAAIRKLYEQFVTAWNKHDVAAMADNWVEDGDHVEPDGHVAKMRGQVAELLKQEHSSVFKSSHLTLTIDSVWFIVTDAALADGTYELSGIVAPDGQQIPARKGRFSTVFIYERSRWWIAASRLMVPATLPYKPKQ
jgi:uncharacterized protein (TIGR02246 family)